MTAVFLTVENLAAFAVAARKLDNIEHAYDLAVSKIVADMTPIVQSSLDLAGLKPWGEAEWAKIGKDSEVLKVRNAATKQIRRRFLLEYINATKKSLAAVRSQIGGDVAVLLSGKELDIYLKGTKGNGNGKVKTFHDRIRDMFSALGYDAKRPDFTPTQEEIDAEGEGEDVVAEVDLASSVEVVKFLRDRKVPMKNLVEASVMYSNGTPEKDWAALAIAQIDPRALILAVAAMSRQQIVDTLGLEGSLEFVASINDIAEPAYAAS